MSRTVKLVTKQGTVVIGSEGITIPAWSRAGGWASMFGKTETLKAEDVREVIITGRDRQYVTGARAAGAVLTGGVALLAPSRMRGMLVISTTSGEVFEFTLLRSDAKRPEAIAAAVRAHGYAVR